MTTSPSTEDLAYAVIRSGRAFARLWFEASIDTRGSTRSLWPATCRRLEEGQPFEDRDIDVVTLMGEALRVALNAQCPGYGDRALRTAHCARIPATMICGIRGSRSCGAWRRCTSISATAGSAMPTV